MAGRILVVEDDAAIARSVRRLLAHEEYYVANVPSAEDAEELIAKDEGFDLVLLDVALPGVDGYTCCSRLRETGFRQPILMLTARGGSEDKVAGLRAGADDYITKPFEPSELLARVAAHLRRRREYSGRTDPTASIALGVDRHIDFSCRDVRLNGERCHLTRREFELLALLARRPNEPLTQRWLYEQVWGCASETAVKLLAVTIRRLRLKVEPDPEHPQFVETVRGYGYRLAIGSPQAV